MAKQRSRQRTTAASNRMRFEPIIDRYLSECYRKQTVARASELAQFLNANRRYVSKLVREAFGKKLTTIMRERQLAHAEILLLTTNLPVEEIWPASAFGDRSSFFRNFQNAYGESPMKYRLKNSPNATVPEWEDYI